MYFLEGRSISEAASTRLLKVGDCIQQWYSDPVLPQVVLKARCDGPHFGEVFAILPIPETQDYPGDEALKRFGASCSQKLFDYAPDLPDGPVFQMLTGYPNSDAWANGDRSVICVAQSKGERWSSIRA